MTDNPESTTVIVTRENSKLALVIAGWLHANSRSPKTKKAYEDTLNQFRAALQFKELDLDNLASKPEPRYHGISERQVVTLTAQDFAAWSVIPDKKVAATTHNRRLSALSSFYEYAILNDFLEYNPIKKVKRKKVQPYKSSKALETEVTAAGLASIDRSTQLGKRDYAILSVLLATGRRLSEVASLQWQDVYVSRAGIVTLNFPYLKGGKETSDKLDSGTSNALLVWLRDYYGEALSGITANAPLWVSLSEIGDSRGHPLSIRSFSDITKKYFNTGKVHRTRHTWTKNMLQEGAPLPLIQQKLGHNSLATTGIYAQSLDSPENPFIEKIAKRAGIE